MGKDLKILLVIVFVIVVVGVISVFTYEGMKDRDVRGSDAVRKVGGERDRYGCLGAAGYRWNESELACVREWEVGEARYQVTDFYTCEAAGYDVMESYPRQCRALNGEVFVEGISPAECLEMGGRTLNVVGGDECFDNETNVAIVVGFISPNICCVPRGF